jgi:hypothetical protein
VVEHKDASTQQSVRMVIMQINLVDIFSKSITMHVDDIEVEKVYDDWGIIYDELYLETSGKGCK